MPIDFNELRAVNPIDLPSPCARNVFFACAMRLKGLRLTRRVENGYGVFLQRILIRLHLTM
jgi:hypothetical protein